MRIIAHIDNNEMLVSMERHEWTSLRRIAGISYTDCDNKEVGTSCNIKDIHKALDEIDNIKGMKKEISELMKKWENASSFIALRLGLEKPKED